LRAFRVDYCLFYLRREREERTMGAGREAALRTAAGRGAGKGKGGKGRPARS
jgi:uncharacterized membrane protein YdfJ with MMPL/SSD domain